MTLGQRLATSVGGWIATTLFLAVILVEVLLNSLPMVMPGTGLVRATAYLSASAVVLGILCVVAVFAAASWLRLLWLDVRADFRDVAHALTAVFWVLSAHAVLVVAVLALASPALVDQLGSLDGQTWLGRSRNADFAASVVVFGVVVRRRLRCPAADAVIATLGGVAAVMLILWLLRLSGAALTRAGRTAHRPHPFGCALSPEPADDRAGDE